MDQESEVGSRQLEVVKQGFLDEAFSDGEQASFGRLGAGISLLFVCGWITRLVWRVADFSALPNLAIFIGACAAFVATLYGLSRAGDVIEAIKTVPKPEGKA
jgi:hypothetical protein